MSIHKFKMSNIKMDEFKRMPGHPQIKWMMTVLYDPKSHSSSSRMRVIYHNWTATKQRPHPQSVAEISHHSVLSGDRIRQCETSSGSRQKDTDQCL